MALQRIRVVQLRSSTTEFNVTDLQNGFLIIYSIAAVLEHTIQTSIIIQMHLERVLLIRMLLLALGMGMLSRIFCSMQK